VTCDSYENFTSFHSSTRFWKGFVIYTLDHGIIAMKKHVTNEHNLDLMKYMRCTNTLEGMDGGKWKKM
jgi:hypothetical protein